MSECGILHDNYPKNIFPFFLGGGCLPALSLYPTPIISSANLRLQNFRVCCQNLNVKANFLCKNFPWALVRLNAPLIADSIIQNVLDVVGWKSIVVAFIVSSFRISMNTYSLHTQCYSRSEIILYSIGWHDRSWTILISSISLQYCTKFG